MHLTTDTLKAMVETWHRVTDRNEGYEKPEDPRLVILLTRWGETDCISVAELRDLISTLSPEHVPTVTIKL